MSRDRAQGRGGPSPRRGSGEREEPETEVRHQETPPKAIERSILGAWRIEETELWDRDALDLLGPARIEFGREHLGTIRLAAIEGSIHFRVGTRSGAPFVEFSWSRSDDADPACGRGARRRTVRPFFEQRDKPRSTRRERAASSGAVRLRRDPQVLLA